MFNGKHGQLCISKLKMLFSRLQYRARTLYQHWHVDDKNAVPFKSRPNALIDVDASVTRSLILRTPSLLYLDQTLYAAKTLHEHIRSKSYIVGCDKNFRSFEAIQILFMQFTLHCFLCSNNGLVIKCCPISFSI